MTPTTPDLGRNDPCPCGSGKKYKKCCLAPGGNGRGGRPDIATHVTPATRRAVGESRVWRADVVPFPAIFEDDATARPAGVLVVAEGLVLASEMVGRGPSEPADIADLLERAVRSAAGAMEGWPETLEVRHPEIAEALAMGLAGEGVSVAARRHLEDLDDVALRLAADMGGWSWDVLPTSMPETWAGWGLPAERVADLFAAAADFRRAEPWVRLPNERLLTLRLPDGREWTVSILGHAGQEYGLAMYGDPDDFASLLEAFEPVAAFARFEGPVLSLTFDPREGLPRPMQREVASAGWEVADPDAYPVLMATNTPAGGVSRRAAADLCAGLRAVAALARAHPEALSRGERAEWRDPEADVEIVHLAAEESPFADPWFALWDVPEEFSPTGPEGPGARPEAVLDLPEGDRLIAALAGPRAWAIWSEEEAAEVGEEAWVDPAEGEVRGAPPRDGETPGSPQLRLDQGLDDAWLEEEGVGDEEDARLEDEGFEDEGFEDEGFEDEAFEDAWFEDEGFEDAWLDEDQLGSEELDDREPFLIEMAVLLTIDRFFEWLLYERELSLATGRKHARNASAFVSFLFGTAGVPLASVTEYDLRRFLFEWYPRQVSDAKYLAESLPVSLKRFFRWLAEAEEIECPWAREVLRERREYEIRYYDFPGGFWWDTEVGEWSAELWEDLDRRVLLADPRLGEGSEWGEEGPFGRAMGPQEARLEEELQRRWLLWRDEEIRGGRVEPDPLRAALVRRQRAWETSPHPGLDGLTPVEAIEREREGRRS